MVREWGGFHRKAINFLAAVRPASTISFLSLVMLTSDRSISKRTGIVTGMVTDTISESSAVTLVQNCETGRQFHIICKKVPEAFIEHKLARGQICSVYIVKVDLLAVRVAGGFSNICPDL